MRHWILGLGICLLVDPSFGNDAMKKAFSEGIKASVEVVKYEREQALKAIPEGYCVTVIGKDNPLDMWEEVKLESLALFLKLDPSLLVSKNAGNNAKRILCLSIAKERQEADETLKKIGRYYPKIDEYITKVEILPSKAMHRIIPGVGKFYENKQNEIEVFTKKLTPERTINGRLVLLSENEKSKILFDNGSTRVVGTPLKNVSYVEHTVYRRKSQ